MQAELRAGWTSDRVGRRDPAGSRDGAGWRGRIARALSALARPAARVAPRLQADAEVRALALGTGDALRLSDAVGTTLRVLDGDLWITLDGDPRDVILGRGERFVVDRDGPVLALPLERSALVAIDRAADARAAA